MNYTTLFSILIKNFDQLLERCGKTKLIVRILRHNIPFFVFVNKHFRIEKHNNISLFHKRLEE
jgi:hypothetical protein